MSRIARTRTNRIARTRATLTPEWQRVLVLVLALGRAGTAAAADRYAVIVTGASAGPSYAMKYDGWRNRLVSILARKFQYPSDHLFVLAENEGADVRRATRENVRAVFADLRARLAADDLLFVVLVGHGTIDDEEGKFNLVGPDLTSSEWAAIVRSVQGPLVFVDTTGGSFPFLKHLSAPERVVMTATDSTAQQFETVFPEFFVKAFEDGAADQDKNGRVSMWEAFTSASAAVRQWYEQHGQLPTERPLLDDNGDGIGRDALNPGADGALARTIYLALAIDTTVATEQSRRLADLQRQLDDLRTRKAQSANPAQFDTEIERVLLEIARVSRGVNGR